MIIVVKPFSRGSAADLNLEGKQSAFAVQKWEGISSPSPTKVWEVIYGA